MNFFENAVIFDKFQVIEKIEDGTVFSSYLGKNLDTGAKVFIKILNPDKYTRYEVDKICYSNELSAIKSFDHRNIMHILESGSYSNTICIVSEYVGSIQLDEYLKGRGALDLKTSISFVMQLASALRYAHSKNILHRNLKASNIGLYESNGETILKIYDFGLSYIIDYSSTPSDQVDADFGFMAPESTGLLDKKVEVRSDLYSLGVLFYRFVTGNYPFHADTIDNMVYQHVAVMPKEPTEFNPAVPEVISKLIMKLLLKDPEQRYQTANELINDLDLFLSSNTAGMHMRDEDLLQTMDQRSRLLSRKNELAHLRNHYTKALESTGRFCLVRGSLGSGKSDLFANLCNELSSSDIPYFRAHFSSQSTMTPYFAFHDILSSFAAYFDKYDRKLQMTERNRLARCLMGLSDLVFKITPEMKRVLPESLALPALEGFREQQRSVMLLSNFFLTLLPQERPYVLILDDIHYADAASLSLLDEMAQHVSEYKVFVVCSCRATDDASEYSSYLQSFLDLFKKEELFTEIDLNPFDEDRMCEYLSDLLILDKDDCQALASYILEKTSGNPYFAVNIIRAMLEDGVISVNSGVLEQNWETLRTVTPGADVFQIIERRMAKLSPETINILEIASMIGDNFDLKVIQQITGLSRENLLPLVSGAVTLQFIEYSSTIDIMQFSHRDIHSVFEHRISPERKQKLHYDIARAIEALNDDKSQCVYELIRHYTAAGSDADVRRFILDAASLARFSNANTEALAYFNKALSLIEREGGEGSEDWCISMDASIDLNLAVGNFDTAINSSERLLPHMGDDIDRAKLYHRIALAYYRMSQYDKCEEMLLNALRYLGEKLPVDEFHNKSRLFALQTKMRLELKLHPDPTARKIRPDQDPRKARAITSIYETLCWVYAYIDESSFKYIALRLYNYTLKHLGPSTEFATALSIMSIFYMLTGNSSHCDETAMLSMKIRTAENSLFGQARSNFISGVTLQWRSDIEKSIKYLREAENGFTAVGDLWELNNTRIYLCNSLLMSGEYNACERLCEECIETSERLNDLFAMSMAYSCLISCYTEMGNYANAEEVAKRCKLIIDKLNFSYATLNFYYSYGRLLIETSKFADAITVFTKARDILESSRISPSALSSVYGYLAIAKTQMLSRDRVNLNISEVQNTEFEIGSLCEKAIKLSKGRNSHRLIAYRAEGLYGILTERYKRTEQAYNDASALLPLCQYQYENAKFDYDYGQYLLSKHRMNEARFYIFEAYMTFANLNSTHYMKTCEQIVAEKFKEAFRNNALLSDVTARRNRMNVDRKVNTLLRLGDRLTSTLELEDLQRKILQDAVELVGAERGILFLYPETGEKKLYVASVYNLGSFDCNTYDWMLAEVENNRKPIVINDVQSDEFRKHYSVMARYGIKSVMAMPMFVRGNLFGVIYLDSRLVRQIFTDDYIEAMGFIANQAGAPIENARLYHRAITDGLTGIYGRSYLDNLVIDRTSDENAKLAAIMIDVDNFKRCNDTYGHPFGDKVLKQIASIMRRIAGESGVPCRYGGEEFVVILDSNDPEYALDIANKIRQTVENSTLACNNGTDVALISVTISLGVSIWNPSEMERIDLIEHADKALYYAKTHGKNQAVMWNPDIQ